MGRPNYINRKIEGFKLGQAVAKDLVKRIPPNLHAKAALRDPVVELDVTGKCLGGDGFQEIAGALVQSIDYYGEHGRVVRLEELCLRDNKLDAKCLVDLGQVLRRASDDLRDLDLSSNSIRIITDDDAAAFEYFLRSFAECYVLRRVDFSGNPLGTRAFEVLTKVYGSEQPLFMAGMDDEPPDSCHSDLNQNNAARDDSGLDGRFGNLQIAASPELRGLYTTTRGLRSIPYLVLAECDDELETLTKTLAIDTSMSEYCALHLSYIIPHHLPPSQLLKRVPPAKAGLATQHLFTHDLDRRCQGLVYFPNTNLGSAGAKVLELAELSRRKMLEELDPESSDTRNEEGIHSITTTASELDRARSRIQGNALRDFGAKSNDLWATALRMLCFGRIICHTRVRQPSRVQLDENKSPISNGLKFTEPTQQRSHKPVPLILRGFNQPQTLRLGQVYRKGKLVLTPIAANPETHETSVSPTLPPKTIPESPTPSPREQCQEQYRSSQLFNSFTEEIWQQIASYVVEADGIMSKGQQLSVLRWAMDRRTLSQEKESLGKLKSAQIWKVLDATGCLAYEMKS